MWFNPQQEWIIWNHQQWSKWKRAFHILKCRWFVYDFHILKDEKIINGKKFKQNKQHLVFFSPCYVSPWYEITFCIYHLSSFFFITKKKSHRRIKNPALKNNKRLRKLCYSLIKVTNGHWFYNHNVYFMLPLYLCTLFHCFTSSHFDTPIPKINSLIILACAEGSIVTFNYLVKVVAERGKSKMKISHWFQSTKRLNCLLLSLLWIYNLKQINVKNINCQIENGFVSRPKCIYLLNLAERNERENVLSYSTENQAWHHDQFHTRTNSKYTQSQRPWNIRNSYISRFW